MGRLFVLVMLSFPMIQGQASAGWWEAADTTLHGAAVDPAGNAIVVGHKGSPPNHLVAVHKVAADGTAVWSMVGTGGLARRVQVDGGGSIIFAGETAAGTWLVRRLDPAGGMLWEHRSYPERATDLAFAPSGNIVVVGSGGRFAEYTSSGGLARDGVVSLGGGATDNPSVEVHGNGDVTLAGPALVHVSASFQELWRVAQPFRSPGLIHDIALDSFGDILLAGAIGGSPTVGRFSTASGTPSWIRSYPGTAPDDAFYGVDVEPGDHVLAVGALHGESRIARFHRTGALVDWTSYEFPPASADAAYPGRVVQAVVNGAGSEARLAIDFERTAQSSATVVSFSLGPLSNPGPRRFTTGEGPGLTNSNTVRMFDAGGSPQGSFIAYGAGRHGTNVATADIDGATGDEQLTGPGPGTVYGPQVRGFTGPGSPIAKVSFYAYGTLRFGVNVGSGGLDADLPHEILTGAGPGAIFGPHVRGFNYDGVAISTLPGLSFFGYGTLRYGVSVAAGYIDASPRDEILTGPGPGTPFGPQLRGFAYDGTGVAAMSKVNFDAFGSGLYGATVAASDVEGDYYDEILAGRGPGGTLAAEAATFDFDGSAIAAKGPVLLVDAATKYGVNVAGGDLENDSIGDLLAGVGDDPTGPARVRAFRWLPSGYLSVPTADFFAFTPSSYGVNVAAGDVV